jgi:flagellar operon protein
MLDHKIHFNQLNQPIIPVGSAKETSKPQRDLNAGVAFKQVLQQEMSGLKFSQHAQQRLRARNIQLSPQELHQLNVALDKAAQKGAKDALFVMPNLALVVNIPNKTVITAVDGANMQESVFTNIDSAVIV